MEPSLKRHVWKGGVRNRGRLCILYFPICTESCLGGSGEEGEEEEGGGGERFSLSPASS